MSPFTEAELAALLAYKAALHAKDVVWAKYLQACQHPGGVPEKFTTEREQAAHAASRALASLERVLRGGAS